MGPDGEVHDVEAIEGFVGTAPDGRVRVFFDDELKTFVDLAPDAVKFRRVIDDPAAVAPRSRLWVDRSALEEPVEADALGQLQDYLQTRPSAPRLSDPSKGDVSSLTHGWPGWPPPPARWPGYTAKMSGHSCCFWMTR